MKFLTLALFGAVVSSASITDTIHSTEVLTITSCANDTTTNSTGSYVPQVVVISSAGAATKQIACAGIAAVLAGAILAL